MILLVAENFSVLSCVCIRWEKVLKYSKLVLLVYTLKKFFHWIGEAMLTASLELSEEKEGQRWTGIEVRIAMN